MNILVSRMGARGDVLIASAILPALKKKYKDAVIDFQTEFPDVLYNNPYVDRLVFEVNPMGYDLIIGLDMAYENEPDKNILQAYADVARVDVKDCEPYINCSQVNKPLLDGYVVVHAGNTNWAGRNWIPERFKELAMNIHNAGYQIICVGSKEDTFVPSDCDVRGKSTMGQLATIIKDAKLFIGIDSFPMHVAQTFNVPGVVFFGSIRPETRVFRKNIKAVNDISLPCIGCHNRKIASVATHECETGTLACEKNISVDTMWVAVQSLIANAESRNQESSRISLN